MEQRIPKIVAFVTLVSLLLGIVGSAHGDIRFQEVTQAAGILRGNIHMSDWGGCWGDFNGDLWPDLWVGNHGSRPMLYLNNRDGTFTNVASTVLSAKYDDDKHGCAWADFDNDGDQDLVQLIGGAGGTSGPNHLFVNNGGLLQDQAAALGVEYPGRGRTPLWLDWDGDGRLDLLIPTLLRHDALDRPATLLRQDATGFEDVSKLVGLDVTETSQFALLSDLTGDGRAEILIGQSTQFPVWVYDTGSVPFADLRASLGIPITGSSIAAVAADLNNDLSPDLYIVRGTGNTEVAQINAQTVGARLVTGGAEKGFSFRTTDNVSFKLGPAWTLKLKGGVSKVFIGAAGQHPTAFSFTLSPADPAVRGILSHKPGVDRGIYIGYDPTAQSWQLLSSNLGDLTFVATGVAPVSNTAAIGFDPSIPPSMDRLLLHTAGGFEDRTAAAGITVPSSGVNIAVGDFDNDMDLDIFIVRTGQVINLPDVLYENQGDGTFVAVPDAGGAAGTSVGRGGVVAVADYDLDGFLDLFLTNGRSPYPLTNGPDQLFHNLGNANHWIELDLEGVVSNRDAIGARLVATAGGISQLREQNGGMHERGAQNHQRIHFGLGSNTAVDQLAITWPSGITQTINALPANELVRVVEPSLPALLGKPSYVVGASPGVFLWKDTPTGPYHLRVDGGGQPTTFTVKLLANARPTAVLPVALESNDQLLPGAFGFALSSVVSGEDGVDFQLPAGAQALLSVEQAGVANPRQLHVGASGAPLSPAGWIKSMDALPPRPQFKAGKDLGLFIGQGSSPQVIEARWDADRFLHHADFTLIATTPITAVQAVSFESNDKLQRTENEVRVQSRVSGSWDGVDITLVAGSNIGLAYVQDGLFQSHRVNRLPGALGQPNAYWLP